jgi:hypothetical protein
MKTESHKYKSLLLVRTILFVYVLYFIFIRNYIANGQINILGILIILSLLMGIVFSIIEIYVALFRSPNWIELINNKLNIKLPFQKVILIDIANVEKIVRSKIFNINSAYGIKLVIPRDKLVLHYGMKKWSNIEGFLKELKKANPDCKVDESLMV